MQPTDLEANLAAAVGADLISPPHRLTFPPAHPFFSAISACALPEGCLPPPGHPPRRVGTGNGATREAADRVALLEAVERYSLQYASDRPERLAPIETLGGAPDPLPLEALCLGAPGAPRPVNSNGCAAGATLADAADRAALETLERARLAAAIAGERPFHPVAAEEIPELDPHLGFLATQARTLRLSGDAGPGYAVIAAHLADPDGGRPILASAGGRTLAAAALRATEEAMFQWRNMIELERNGVPVPPADADGPGLFRCYRGLAALGCRAARTARRSRCRPGRAPSSSFRRKRDGGCGSST